MTSLRINFEDIDVIVFDFDGVLTNNLVYIDQSGIETVRCSRADGIAFEFFSKKSKPTFIISTEKNPVVSMRAKKLNVPVIQGSSDKISSLNKVLDDNGYDINKTLFVGNDINDYAVMKKCGYSACPADSHRVIKEIATVVLESKGGSGVARELLEKIFGINILESLYTG
jgi:YrbI family 3-deoxy-D-manno-octulosonate 8-phosphate phosphatase